MIIMTVTDKKFGKNFVDYKIENKDTGEVETGKCGNMGYTAKLFFDLVNQHGDSNVQLRHR